MYIYKQQLKKKRHEFEKEQMGVHRRTYKEEKEEQNYVILL